MEKIPEVDEFVQRIREARKKVEEVLTVIAPSQESITQEVEEFT